MDLSTRDGLAKGGDSGAAFDDDSPAESLALQRVMSGEMPPKHQGKSQTLPADEQDRLKQWFAGKAPWPKSRKLDLFERTSEARGGRDWWSLQPIRKPQVPTVSGLGLAANPIDAFIFTRLKQHGLTMAPPLDRRALIRRVSFDLLGLPPTFDETESFARDDSPGSYERLIDRLLASPQYGERWGRFWLDVARYAETCGYERDQTKPNAWKYRDWVIRSFNEDKPYDRFIVEQLAGDELPGATEQTVVATGFLRLGTWNDEPNDPQEYKYERLEDLVHATSTAFLGMTVKCARCHDHKFDPIRQTDYYRMAAVFWAGFIEPGPRDLLGGPDARTLGFDVLGWTDRRRDPPPLHLLKKGDPNRPGPIVAPGQLSMIPSLDRPFSAPGTGARTSGRRLQLAKWIVDPANPLTARVWVNRIWQQHFGQGLVRSTDNFGFTGDRPTHPELLDWLASQLIEGGWTIKRLHRLILTSKTYQQSAVHPHQQEFHRVDAGNRYYWRANRKRLDAEALRDSLLAVGRRLDRSRMGGPSFYPAIAADALEGLSMKGKAWTASPPDERRRRSVYMFVKRGLLPPFMTTFDLPDTTLPCTQRDVTLVAPQALALLNDEFVHEQSEAIADLIAGETADTASSIRQAWRMITGREPREHEMAEARVHMERQRDYFARRSAEAAPKVLASLVSVDGLVLDLRSDEGVELDPLGKVRSWSDQSGHNHHAAQSRRSARPKLVRGDLAGKPFIRFDGRGTFLELAGQVLNSQEFSLFAVVRDLGGRGHRTLFSNWAGAKGNSTTSVFLGTTGAASLRLSDDFGAADVVRNASATFVLGAVAGKEGAWLYQNGVEIARKSSSLATRVLTTPYVVGQQGNIQGEWWNGDLAELIAFDRSLSDEDRSAVTQYLMRQHGLVRPRTSDPARDALASLCHVLLNTNEFLYVE